MYKVLTPHTHALGDSVPPGSIYRINTGAPLPAGTDAVLMVEDTRLHSTDANEEESEVEALAQVDPGENTRKPGSDVRKGDLAVEKGTIFHGSGGEIGTLAFVGRQTVSSIGHSLVGRNKLTRKPPGPSSCQAGCRRIEHGERTSGHSDATEDRR